MAKAVWISVYICFLTVVVDVTLSSPVATSNEVAVRDDSNVAKVRKSRQAGACGCDMTVYDSNNFGGRSLLVRQQNANFGNDYFNDRTESVKIAGTCSWLMYQNINFNEDDVGSTYLLTTGDYPSASGISNQISSARALPPPGTNAIVLFQHGGYRGRMLVLYDSDSQLPSLDFNDKLSSFIITGGSWTLYQHTSYTGSSATFGVGEYSSLPSTVSNDQISSIKAN